eukprot:CAMPEP_0119008482 /NCGR_PEP_ID=MMETSP1176-20130426/3723_1 /TAXON_ID=265551 /ORGANISM="Synedropsis recta cf, Strain CCMP1620" /LENGTH=179 /DNA_ID=CAMNT_0006960819 /DNA_START=80 /DNA_END=619 /DNA_ORIENTATION=-
MRVSGFMVPANKAFTCLPDDSIKSAVQKMTIKKVGALVVMDGKNPVSILTKTDFVQAYQNNVPLEMTVRDIMIQDLKTVRDNIDRNQAAKFFESSKTHHAIVVDGDKKFVGIISSWDVAVEAGRDDRAWPWIRSEDGKFHNPNEKAPTPTVESPTSVRRESHAYLDYIDSIRSMPYMDD